ncbi:hypothetical protein J4434_02475 [Candidatus Woesearchaeota archaeon]|nr:hypothetical protein [Candidatus Woesearchaeota archaeon]
MAAESGIYKTAAEGIITKEETPETLKEKIKKLKIEIKFINYFYPIAGAVSLLVISSTLIYGMGNWRPNKIYSISRVYDGKVQYDVGDLDGNGVPDLVLEQDDKDLTPFFGHKNIKGGVTYVKASEMDRLNPNSKVDYDCIDETIRHSSATSYITDEQKEHLDKERSKLYENGFDPTGIKCVKGGSDNSNELKIRFTFWF